MEVIVAKTAGFCFGVERAVDKVYQQIEKTDEPIYTYGPIIHNEEVVKDLEEKGVKVIYSEEELRSIKSGVIVIRSHGVSRAIYDLIRDKGLGHLPLCEEDPQDRGEGDKGRSSGGDRGRCPSSRGRRYQGLGRCTYYSDRDG